MEYPQTCRFPVGQKQVYGLAMDAARSERCRNAYSHCEDVTSQCRIGVGQVCRVAFRNDEDKSGVERLNTHERENVLQFTNTADRPLASDQFTENAVFHSTFRYD